MDNIENKIEVLNEVNKYMVRLRLGVQAAYENFQCENIGIGAEMLSQCIEGLQWVMEAITLTSELHNEEIDVNDLNGKLNEIVEGFSNEDYVLIGDLLEYELSPILEQWQLVVNNVVEKC